MTAGYQTIKENSTRSWHKTSVWRTDGRKE